MLNFKQFLKETSDITGIEPPVQRPDLLNRGAYPTYEVQVAKFQKKMKKKSRKSGS